MASVENQDVEAVPALADAVGQLRDRGPVDEVDRRDGRAAAGGVNAFFDLFERLGGAGDEDDMGAGFGERFGGGGTDAAAGAGDERQLAGERLRIGHGRAFSGLRREKASSLALRADIGQRRRIVAGEAGVAALRRDCHRD